MTSKAHNSTAAAPPPSHNLLLVSDVHLARFRPHMMQGGQNLFGAFLDHHARTRLGQRPWRLIVNGDLLDFDHQASSIHERSHEAESLLLFEGIEAASRDAFLGFARFLEAGHEVVIIPGNHDRDLMWPRVREAFVEAVGVHLLDRAALARLSFHDWFYYEPGRIYVEHGHQYEPDTSLCGMLDPFIEGSPTAIRRDLATWWIADFCPLIPEIAYHVDHTRGPLFYLPIVIRSLAWKAPYLWVKLLSFIFRTVASAGIQTVRSSARHAERRAQLGRESGLGEEKLRAIEACMITPRISSRLQTAGRLHMAAAVIFPFVAVFGVLGAILGSWLLGGWALGLFGALVVLNMSVSSRFAGHNVASLRKAAGQLQELVGTPIVSFGHNHAATDEPAGAGRYLNSGTWSDPRVPNSYLRVVGSRGEVRGWEAEGAPALAPDSAEAPERALA